LDVSLYPRSFLTIGMLSLNALLSVLISKRDIPGIAVPQSISSFYSLQRMEERVLSN
jgi:hypothetical protein